MFQDDNDLDSLIRILITVRALSLFSMSVKGTPPLFFDNFGISRKPSPIGLKFLPQIEHIK